MTQSLNICNTMVLERMTSTVKLPPAVEEAIVEKVESGEYANKSDFIREAVRTHLDRVLLAPEDVAERARELREGETEPVPWEDVDEA